MVKLASATSKCFQIPPRVARRHVASSGAAMEVPKHYTSNPEAFAIKQSPTTDADVALFLRERMNTSDAIAASGVFVLGVRHSLFLFLDSTSTFFLLSL